MATPTFQNSGNNLVVKKADYRMSGVFTDTNALLNMLSEDIRTTHMGVLSAWNQWSLISTPILSMTELKNNTIYLNGNDGELTFNMPYQLDGVTIKEELSTDIAKPGMDGQVFEICLGDGNIEPTYQVGTRIAPDFRDGQNLIIVGVNSEPLGQGFIYKVKLVTNDRNEYYDKRYLKAGTQYYRISGTVNEYDERFAGIDNSFGMMKLKHQLGGGRGVEYTITGDAYRLNLKINQNQGNVSGLDYVMNKANALTPNDNNLYMAIGEGNGQLGTDGMQGFKPGTITWMNMVDAMLLKQITLDEERDLMWASGGVVTMGRNKSVVVGEGLYKQMKRGNWVKLPRYSKPALMNAFGQVFRNRPDIPDYLRRFKLQGGAGAVMELQRIFQEELNTTANQSGAVLQAADLGIVKKVGEINGVTQLTSGFRMQSVFISGLGHLEIEHNPAFDSQYSRTEDEPYIGGFPRHSYTSCIFDLTDSNSTNAAQVTGQVEFAKGVDSGANVYLVRNAAMPGNKVTYINGRTSKFPVSAGSGQVASSRFDGYTTMIENRSNVWLKDPTKSILFELSAPY